MRRTQRPRLRTHSRTALTLACLAAGVSGSAIALPQAPPAPRAAAVARSDEFAGLRAQLRWLPVRVGGRELSTLDAGSRLLLARSAAERAGLAEVGLDFRDVYGVINAETTWVARTGMGRNGVASHGLAQFEPATARALGVRDANDPVEAVHAAATLLKEAAQWSARRIADLGMSGPERAARLREGVSIYYNLSSRARERWNGLGSAGLPVETQRHIANVRVGAQLAERLQRLGAIDEKMLLAEAAAVVRAAPAPAEARPRAESTSGVQRVAAVHSRPAAPRPLGYIAWSSEAAGDGSRGGKHVVWSNGSVTRESGGRVHWSSRTPG